jgi:NADH-quinone oxidoreductase subunit L
MTMENLFLLMVAAPLLWMVLLALTFFTKIPLPEKFLSDSTRLFSSFMFMVGSGLFLLTLFNGPQGLLLDYLDWIEVGEYRFKVRFIVDLLGATYALLSASLIGVIFKFSRNYLHREAGYFRFIFLLTTLLFGLMIVSFARSLDLLFIGWELVGTTSVLLISYFYFQNQPVRFSVKAVISYRLCDMGILAASAWAHHHLHSTDFVLMPRLLENIHENSLAFVFIGIFVVWATLAKSAQLPMCSWLPTAMEGPTPSSAIFYGALSIHLGPFFLLRFHHYLSHFPGLLVLIGGIGASSALYATLVGRTRSDAKTLLAYSTISQVGIIYVEIALGLTGFALFHIVTHASLRTYQFLRSSSLIQDFYENPVVLQDVHIDRQLSWERLFSRKLQSKIYLLALHGFHLDHFTQRFVELLLAPAKLYFSWEKEWMEWDRKLLKKILKRWSK